MAKIPKTQKPKEKEFFEWLLLVTTVPKYSHGIMQTNRLPFDNEEHAREAYAKVKSVLGQNDYQTASSDTKEKTIEITFALGRLSLQCQEIHSVLIENIHLAIEDTEKQNAYFEKPAIK